MERTILLCELAYTHCFADFVELYQGLRFRNPQLPELPEFNHSYLWLPGMSQSRMRQLIDQEISRCKQAGWPYANVIVQGEPVTDEVLSRLAVTPKLTNWGFYQLAGGELCALRQSKKCEILKLDKSAQLQELLQLELAVFGGQDRALRHRLLQRKGRYFLNPKQSFEMFLCYQKELLVGKCSVFVQDGVAKIEDLLVMPEHRRQGLGSALLKEAASWATEAGAKAVYLVTDLQEEAKNLYAELGFQQVGQKTQLLFPLR